MAINVEEQLKKYDRYNDEVHIKPYFDSIRGPQQGREENNTEKLKKEWTDSVLVPFLTLMADFKKELSEEIAKTHIFEIPRLKTVSALRAFEKFEARVTELRSRL